MIFEVMRDTKRIEIKVDEAKQLEKIKLSLEGLKRTPAEQKFLDKLTVGVCVVAALIMYAAYHLFPIIN